MRFRGLLGAGLLLGPKGFHLPVSGSGSPLSSVPLTTCMRASSPRSALPGSQLGLRKLGVPARTRVGDSCSQSGPLLRPAPDTQPPSLVLGEAREAPCASSEDVQMGPSFLQVPAASTGTLLGLLLWPRCPSASQPSATQGSFQSSAQTTRSRSWTRAKLLFYTLKTSFHKARGARGNLLSTSNDCVSFDLYK